MDYKGRTHVRDQAERLRRMTRSRLRRALTIAITSGKGGVGKSTVAVNMSICLASRGLNVTLVDTDLGLANADLLMNVQPRYTLAHVLSGTKSIEEACMQGPAGVRFLAGASGREDLAELSEFARRNLIQKLQKLETSTDILVFDCGAGISRNVTSFAMAADKVIVVTTPEPTALADAYAMIKLMHRERHGENLRAFVNMAGSRAVAQATFARLASVAQRFLNFTIADGGFMLHDVAVELAVQQRRPFVTVYPESNASACMVAMAAEFAQTVNGQQSRGGFFRRVAGLFV